METASIRESLEAAYEPEKENAPAVAPAAAPAEPQTVVEPAAKTTEKTKEASANLNELADQEATQSNDDTTQQETIQPGPKIGAKTSERAPASWRPEVREHWAQLPDTVRSEILRRESEVQRTLQDTAEARKSLEAVTKTFEPYMAFIRAENATPLQAIGNLMSTAAKLRTNTAHEQANMLADLIVNFGVGRFGKVFIEQLDAALAGQPLAADPQQAAFSQMLNQRMAPVEQMVNQFQQAQYAQQQRAVVEAESAVEQFLEKAEFGEDVREDMADQLEIAQRRGVDLSLQEAYRRACFADPRILNILRQRAQSKQAQVGTSVAQTARSKAVQVNGAAPMGALRQEPNTIRAAIEAAISQASR